MSSLTFSEAEREEIRLWLRTWEEAEPALQEQRWRELQALSDEKALSLTKALFRRGITTASKRESSGLVEQQALFKRLRSR